MADETQIKEPQIKSDLQQVIEKAQQDRSASQAEEAERVAELKPFIAPDAPTAPERLRAYEDELFGADCVRIRGLIERGYGSKFKEMTAEQHRHYEALEKLVVAEQALADARAALSAAEDTNARAEVEVSASEPVVHAASAE